MAEQLPFSLLPDCAWRRPIGQGWDHTYVVRYASNLDDGPWHGSPLGGFGAGCIGRSPRGDFTLWHIDGGEHVYQSASQSFGACQFSLFEQATGDTFQASAAKASAPKASAAQASAAQASAAQAYALSTAAPSDGTLSQWQWYPASTADTSTGTYSALYPRSGFVYENVFQAQVSCEQFSPIWPHNYDSASYPVAVFLWRFHNPTDQPLTLSLMVTWQNMVNWFTNANKSPEVQQRDDGSPFYDYVPPLGKSGGNVNQWMDDADTVGWVMDGARQHPDQCQEGEGQWAIAALRQPGVEPFYHSRWNPAGDGADLWQSFAQDGTLPPVADPRPAAADEQIGVALALRMTLAPGQSCQLPVVLTWDFPVTEYAAGTNAYRRYSDFWGRDGRNAWAMATAALQDYPRWHQAIVDWQTPLCDRADLPAWFKMALFNELYDLTSGGTLWTAASDADPVGQFAVLECLDYRWYESLDVRLYGGFGLLMLWPELEKAVIRAFARAIPTGDPTPRIVGYYRTMGQESPPAIRKAIGATPHDLGAPNEHPFVKTNYTSYQDCNQWKDLGSDFVLQVYRAYKLTEETDVDFLADCWPAVVDTLAYLKRFDKDGDSIPENGGAPDQTFDDWQLKGVSAYCGGLWLAALEAAIAIADVLAQHQRAPGNVPILLTQYRRWLKQGRIVYQNKLWTGSYYRLDTQSGSEVVMADQLCGQFMTQLLGLPDVVEPEYVQTALQTIYDTCFIQFNEYVQTHAVVQNQRFAGSQTGSFSAASLGMAVGAANGILPNGVPEHFDDTHQLEVWTGINFGLAAFMAHGGMVTEALTLSEAVVRQVYDYGLQFRTPEAITAVGTFRACHYLRPMAIWGLYGVLSGFGD